MTLEEHFAYFTECQLATVEDLRGKKSTAKSNLRRHESIAEKMIDVCRAVSLPDHALARNPRLQKRLLKLTGEKE